MLLPFGWRIEFRRNRTPMRRTLAVWRSAYALWFGPLDVKLFNFRRMARD